MAVKQYVNEQDENEKSKYKITTSQDTNLKNRKFSKLLNFYVKGYNAPYSFHRDDGTMNEMKKLLGDIEVESDLKENKLLLQYKYTDDQKEGILDFEKVFRRYSGKSDEYYCDFKKMVDEIFKNVLDDDRENIIK
jgi:hypothetical protein